MPAERNVAVDQIINILIDSGAKRIADFRAETDRSHPNHSTIEFWDTRSGIVALQVWRNGPSYELFVPLTSAPRNADNIAALRNFLTHHPHNGIGTEREITSHWRGFTVHYTPAGLEERSHTAWRAEDGNGNELHGAVPGARNLSDAWVSARKAITDWHEAASRQRAR